MTIYKLGGKSSKSSSHVKNAAAAASSSFSNNTQKLFNDLNNNNNSTEQRNLIEQEQTPFVNVKVILPNGTVCHHSIDSQKAIYDLLIELSANARLIPTNFILKLYSDDDNSNCIIEYTPNQKIGQLNPAIIKLVPKTATLKHQQQLFPLETVKKQSEHVSTNSAANKSSSSIKPVSIQTPFELTICVQVNLPFNQKTVVRIKQEISLGDLFAHVCRESNLDQEKYDLYIPNENENEPYTMQDSFARFNTKEVSLMLKKNVKGKLSYFNSSHPNSAFNENSAESRLLYLS